MTLTVGPVVCVFGYTSVVEVRGERHRATGMSVGVGVGVCVAILGVACWDHRRSLVETEVCGKGAQNIICMCVQARHAPE